MCGIIGYNSEKEASKVLPSGIKKLECSDNVEDHGSKTNGMLMPWWFLTDKDFHMQKSHVKDMWKSLDLYFTAMVKELKLLYQIKIQLKSLLKTNFFQINK